MDVSNKARDVESGIYTMTMVNLRGTIPWPMPPFGAAGAFSHTAMIMDAVDERVAYICQVPKTGTISKIVFRTRTVATGGDCIIGIETVDLAVDTLPGFPSGTLVAAGAAALAFNIAINDGNQLLTATLATPWSGATLGDLIAIVINGPTTGTPDIDITSFTDAPGLDFGYAALFDSGSWSKSATHLVCGLEYSDGTFEELPGTWAWSSAATISFNSDSTPDENGMRFQVSFDCKVRGVWAWIDGDQIYDVKLYEDDNTLLESYTQDSSVRSGTSGEVMYFMFNTEVSLTKDTWYRVTILPSTNTPNVTLYKTTTLTVAQMDSNPGGQNMYGTERTNAQAWTDKTLVKVQMGILISQINDGSIGAGRGFNRGFANG